MVNTIAGQPHSTRSTRTTPAAGPATPAEIASASSPNRGPRKNPLKKPLLVAGLVLFFAFDEILLIILFAKIGFPDFSPVTWILIAGVLTFLNLLLALLVYRLIMSRPTTGTDGLVGLRGTVITSESGKGRVFVRGEYWEAEMSGEPRSGDEVEVTSVRGLNLVVKPVKK